MLTAYEEFKRGFKPVGEDLNTETQCAQQGIRFTPMVIESHSGGWSKTARQVLDNIAKHITASWNDEHEAASLAIAQRLSVTLHRESERAILRRRREPSWHDMEPW